MRKICIINQKGGVAKTTTALNLAAGLSRNERKILLIDLDPQSNLELSMNLENNNTVYDFIFQNIPLEECINNVAKNLDIIKGDNKILRTEDIIKNNELIEQAKENLKSITNYDYIIFDCGPSMNAINRFILLYCEEAIIPTSCDYLGFESLTKTMLYLKEFSDFNDHEIKISKIVPTLYDKRNKICNISLESINNEFYQLISQPIRINSKLKESPKNKRSIFSYAPKSSGAQDYLALVQSVLCDEKEVILVET